MLEQKLLAAQELQSRQTQDYFRTQEQFQQAIQKKLEEQAEQQLKVWYASLCKLLCTEKVDPSLACCLQTIACLTHVSIHVTCMHMYS